MVNTSAWPSTGTRCWRCRLARVSWWTASTSPACTLVIFWGDLMPWKMVRAMRGGTRSRLLAVARYDARSRADHSHSRFCRKANWLGNVSELRVVSIWKIFTAPASRRPMRHVELCSSELGGSMNDRLCCIPVTLWWCLRLRYDEMPVMVDL